MADSDCPKTSIWIMYMIMIFTIFFLAFSIANAVYYSKLRSLPQTPTPPVTHGTATTMMWINIILAVFSGILLIVSLIRIVYVRKDSHINQYRKKRNKASRTLQRDMGQSCSDFSDTEQETCNANSEYMKQRQCNKLTNPKAQTFCNQQRMR